ncbi:hypothetical protein Tcan_17845 [Toxocara canis]|uniref:Uncharacterized protein n=1 Tax=Toxocara canis TaxID=6265 RepID=A0A0B2VQ09_TOXCA|nr:hypothetical protein Tcan_17845 [Toxocara canis]
MSTTMLLHSKGQLLPSLVFTLAIAVVISQARTADDNCKSEKLKELILETIGLFPHQYSYQARYMKQQAEDRFGNWWSAVIISEKGGYGMSAVYDQYTNTTYVIFCLFKRTSFFYKIFISPNHMSENHLFICSLYLFLLQNGSHVDV